MKSKFYNTYKKYDYNITLKISRIAWVKSSFNLIFEQFLSWVGSNSPSTSDANTWNILTKFWRGKGRGLNYGVWARTQDFCYDTTLNHHLFQKFKVIENMDLII